MSKRAIKWFLGELPGLVAAGLLPSETAGRLREHYEQRVGRESKGIAVLISGVLGSVLIGCGVILLLAHNWDALTRPLRACLALAPLLVCQVLAGWVMATGRDSAAWRESLGAIIFLLIGSSIALVGQTYNIPGDLGGFLLTWMLLGLPLIYLLDASLPCLFYLAGTVFWAGYAQESGGHALYFWPMFAAGVPHMVWVHRRTPDSPRVPLEGWLIALSLCVGVGIAMEKCVPGLWVIVYMGMFGAFYLATADWSDRTPGIFQNPFHTVGACGIAVLSFLLTFEWVWDEVGWSHYRYAARFYAVAAIPEYVATLALPSITIVLLARAVGRRQWCRVAYGAAPFLAIATYCMVSGWSTYTMALVLFNLYALALGLLSIAEGIREARTGMANGGVAIVAGLTIARFFDADMSFMSRGIAFIVLGVLFLVANVLIARRRKARQEGGAS